MQTQLLLSLWQEASRHIALHESIVRLTALVRRVLPADLVIVRRLCREECFVETIAVGASGRMSIPKNGRSPVPDSEWARLDAWSKSGQVQRGKVPSGSGPLNFLAPLDAKGHVLAGPLRSESGAVGALVLMGRAGAFSEDHERLFRQVLDPFTAAYENHWRIRELQRFQEAVEAENRALLTRLKRQEVVEDVVGVNGSLKSVMERVEQVAPTNAPVLILGETGTGKEVIARAIHARSTRRDGPIVRVNCGAIPPELVDSELFGHEKGSFTGAVNTRKGWFERADGGTLFLDEIGELPPAAQVRLLRILQDGSYERVGGQHTMTADVRILAATHRNLKGLVREGRFREDLWYRISVFPIELPPLRARKADIPALANHFARNAGLRLGGYPLTVSDEDIQLLMSYDWPGNVREMSAVIERATILGGGHRLDLKGAMGRRADGQTIVAARPNGSAGPEGGTGSAGRFKTLDEAMAEHIALALRTTKGRIEGPDGAAALLDIHPNTLRARMQKLGLDWRLFRKNGSAMSERSLQEG